jgi:hypothetical protein
VIVKVVEEDKREVESLLAKNKNEFRENRTKKWKAGVDQVPEGRTNSIRDPRDAPARDWHLVRSVARSCRRWDHVSCEKPKKQLRSKYDLQRWMLKKELLYRS